MEIESAVHIIYSGIAVNYRCRNYIWVVWICVADGYCFSEEVYVTITWTGIGSGLNFDDIAVDSMIDGGLDIVEIGRAIVVDGDNSSLGG